MNVHCDFNEKGEEFGNGNVVMSWWRIWVKGGMNGINKFLIRGILCRTTVKVNRIGGVNNCVY